jgi:hypothetical protein
MTKRRLTAYIDALADGRRPDSFEVDPEDADVLRTAIYLRSGRPGDSVPDEQFIDQLHAELADESDPKVVPISRQGRAHRRRSAVAALAAGLVLVGGTAAVTETLGQSAPRAAIPAAHGSSLRTGTFETSGGQVRGQIVVSRGNPSWVFMNVGGTNYTGPIACKLQVKDGSTVATGNFVLHGGSGAFSKAIQVDVGALRGATLVTPSGVVVASATFA